MRDVFALSSAPDPEEYCAMVRLRQLFLILIQIRRWVCRTLEIFWL